MPTVKVDKLEPIIVEKVDRPVCTASLLFTAEEPALPIAVEREDKPEPKVEKFMFIIVLNVDIVDMRFVFCVDKLEPVIVEKVDRPTIKVERLDPVIVEKVDRPTSRVMKLSDINVLKDETVDWRFVF